MWQGRVAGEEGEDVDNYLCFFSFLPDLDGDNFSVQPQPEHIAANHASDGTSSPAAKRRRLIMSAADGDADGAGPAGAEADGELAVLLMQIGQRFSTDAIRNGMLWL